MKEHLAHLIDYRIWHCAACKCIQSRFLWDKEHLRDTIYVNEYDFINYLIMGYTNNDTLCDKISWED